LLAFPRLDGMTIGKEHAWNLPSVAECHLGPPVAYPINSGLQKNPAYLFAQLTNTRAERPITMHHFAVNFSRHCRRGL